MASAPKSVVEEKKSEHERFSKKLPMVARGVDL